MSGGSFILHARGPYSLEASARFLEGFAPVRKEMESRLWADFARQYPSTAPLFAAINSARG